MIPRAFLGWISSIIDRLLHVAYFVASISASLTTITKFEICSG